MQFGRRLAVVEGKVVSAGSAQQDRLKAMSGEIDDLGQLVTQLAASLAAARRFYNNAAAEYNASREAVPGVFFANSMGFQPQDFFNLEEGERKAASTPPQVKF